MIPFRIVAIPTEVAAQVRKSQVAPVYGHPAHTEVAAGYGPCRHCLQTFDIGQEQRILFTYDPFQGIEDIPLPGPIFIHALACDRYPEHKGYPQDMLPHAAVLTAFSKGQRFIGRVQVNEGSHVAAIQKLLERADVDYIEVRDKEAGCYDFRIERD